MSITTSTRKMTANEEMMFELGKKSAERDWKMLLSEIELMVLDGLKVTNLDTSDQSKWGKEYAEHEAQITQKYNWGVEAGVRFYTAKLLEKLDSNL